MKTDQLDIFTAPAPLAVIHGDSLTREEAAVLRLLEGHKGHANAVTGEMLAGELNMGYNAVRDVIRHLRKHHRLLIGATNTKPQGYFMAVTPEDMDLALRNMIRRAMSMLVMAAQLKKVSPEEIFGQAKMELEAKNCNTTNQAPR
jgi:RIO-like serine/threonine protein kinase